MSVIEAASAGVKDMADGSLRITFEFEPRHAADAFALFGPRGRSVAIAALADGHARASDTSPEPVAEEPKKEREHLGDLCWRAVQWCNDPEFRRWLGDQFEENAGTEYRAALKIKAVCGVESRKDLDANPVAAEKFNRLIRGPYQKHLQARGLV